MADMSHCVALRKNGGATRFNRILRYAALRGHESLCRLAKEWGATNFDWMLWGAAFKGHESLCRLAIEWGAGAR